MSDPSGQWRGAQVVGPDLGACVESAPSDGRGLPARTSSSIFRTKGSCEPVLLVSEQGKQLRPLSKARREKKSKWRAGVGTESDLSLGRFLVEVGEGAARDPLESQLSTSG